MKIQGLNVVLLVSFILATVYAGTEIVFEDPNPEALPLPPPPPLPPAGLPEPQEPIEEEGDKSECYQDHECQPYSYCFHSIFGPNTCNTNNRVESHWYSAYCRQIRTEEDGSIKSWPDHQKCREWEVEKDNLDDVKFAVSRCYESLDYTCHKAYLAPCTPNYDNDGNVITGEEEMCPEMFRCGEKSYGGKSYKLCLPIEPEVYYSETCETPFDCGFSQLEHRWPTCSKGQCLRAVQK